MVQVSEESPPEANHPEQIRICSSFSQSPGGTCSQLNRLPAMLIVGSDRTGRSDPSWSAQRPPSVATRQVATLLSLPQQGGVPAARPARGVMNSAPPKLAPVLFSPPSERRQAPSGLTSRTSDNPHRPRLASSPSPLHRGTFGHRQTTPNSPPKASPKPPSPLPGKTQRHTSPLRAHSHEQAQSERRQAQSEPRAYWEAFVPTSRIRATCAVGSGKEHRREAIQTRGAAVTATRAKTDPTSSSPRLRATRSKPASIETYARHLLAKASAYSFQR